MKRIDTNEGPACLIAWPREEGGKFVLPKVGDSNLAAEYFEVRKQYYAFYANGSIKKHDGQRVEPDTIKGEELATLPDEARKFVTDFIRSIRK